MGLYDDNIARLIRRSLVGDLSGKEQQELDAWRNDSKENDVLFNKVKEEVRTSSEGPVFCSLDDEKAWLKFKTMTSGRKRRVYVRRVFRYAAVIVLPLAVVAALLFLNRKEKIRNLASCPAITIVPGGAKAVLISANGKQYELNGEQRQREIEVERGVVIKQGGTNLVYDSLSVSRRENVLAMNTLKIPRGGEFKLTLSDGTKVYLNSATDLKYPVVFDERERKVYLSGEAYFEVTRDAARPFYVVTDEVRIQVYGTEFNVNTHRKQHVQTVLVGGSIGIGKRDAGNEIVMKPGELASFDRVSGRFDVKAVDVKPYVVWKDGYFTFENETLEQIMSTLSLWYDVDVFFQSEDVKQFVFTGYMKRYNEIDEILNAIADVVKVKFSINERTIVVSK